MADIAEIGFRADTSGLMKAEKGLDNLTAAGKRTDTSLSALQKTVGIVGTALAAIGSTALASQLTRYADTATSIENRLRTVTSSTEQLASAQERLLKIANASRSEYQTTAELYTKLSQSTTELGLSSERLFRITETINKSFAASGASASEASNAIRQLAQGLSAGALRGDEFNSVAEQAPEILRAVAAQTGKTVGELRKFAEQGGITAELLIASLENYGDTVDKVYSKTNATLEQSRTIAANNVTEWVGGNKAIMAATAAFGSAMVAVSENLDGVSAAIQAAASVVGLAMIPALAKYVTGLYAAATATGALSAATSFLLGPWGLLIAAVGAGATAFYMTSTAQKEMAETTKVLDSDIDKLTKSMEGMTKAQRDSLSIDINKRLLDIQKEADAMKELVKTRKAIAGFSNEEVAEFGSLIGVAGINTESLAAAATHGEAKIDTLDARAAELTATLKQLDSMGTSAAKSIAGVGESAESTAKRLLKLDEAMQDRFDAEEELAQIEKDRIARKEEEADAILKPFEEGTKAVKEYATLSEKAAERIESAFADAWLNAFDGFESVVDGMKNAFKRMLAEMAHEAFTKQIVVNMGFGGGASGGAGGGAGGMLGGLGSIFGGSGAASGGGAAGAGAIGGALSSLGPALAMVAIGSQISKALGGTGNLLRGGIVGDVLLGSWKNESQSLGLSLSGGDITGTETSTDVRKKFFSNKRRTSTAAFETSEIDNAFDAITSAISGAAKTFGINSADEVIKGFSASVNLDIKGKTKEEVAAAIQQWIGDTTSSLVSAVFGDSLVGLQREGEGAIDAVNRVTANMRVMQGISKNLGLGFDLTGKAAMIAATNIVDLAGGIEQLSALTNQYYTSFYTEAEQQQNLATQLAESFGKLNVSMPTTREGFRTLVDGLDLTTESGQAMFAALMQLVPGMDQYLSALEAQRTASEQAAEAAQKEAEAKAAALKAQGLDLQIRLYEALGQSSEALALRRQIELESTDETLRAMLLQIYTAEDAAAAQRELASAQSKAAETARDAAQSAFGKLQDAAQREKDRLGTELDLKLSTIDKEREALTSQRDAVIAGYQAQGQAVQQYISQLEGISDVINNFIGSTGSAENPFKRLEQIFNETKAGLTPDQGELQSVLGAISSSGSAGFASATDQQRAMAIARGQAAGIGGVIGGRLAGARSQSAMIAQQIEDANKFYEAELLKLDEAAALAQKQHDEQVALIDKQLSDAEKQLNALLGVDDRILSMTDALAEFYASLESATAVQISKQDEQIAATYAVAAAVTDAAGFWAGPEQMAKPDTPMNTDAVGEPVTEEMVSLMKEILAASKANADHASKSASMLQEMTVGGLDVRVEA